MSSTTRELWIIGAPTAVFRARRTARRCGVACGVQLMIASAAVLLLASVAAGHLETTYGFLEALAYCCIPIVLLAAIAALGLVYLIEKLAHGALTALFFRVVLSGLPFRGARRVHEFFDSSLAAWYGLVLALAGWIVPCLTLLHDGLTGSAWGKHAGLHDLGLGESLLIQAAVLVALFAAAFKHFDWLDERSKVVERAQEQGEANGQGGHDEDDLICLAVDPLFSAPSADERRYAPALLNPNEPRHPSLRNRTTNKKTRAVETEGDRGETSPPRSPPRFLAGSLFLGSSGMRRFILHCGAAACLALLGSLLHLLIFFARGGHAGELVMIARERGVLGGSLLGLLNARKAMRLGLRSLYGLLLSALGLE